MSAKSDFQSLADFISDFTKTLPRLAAISEGINLYGATTFSPFAIFNPDENTLSRVVAELFDPSGSHGQGLLFLNNLLAAIAVPRINRLDVVRVRREAMTRAHRRIDIVIETSGYVIGIENKPWAIQQKDQLRDYLEELKSDLRGRRPILIFLSEQDAETAGDETVRIPYYDPGEGETTLYELLSNSLDEIKAAAPKAFVVDFLRYIAINFGDEYVETPADKPYVEAVNAEFDDHTKRKAIATILLSQETVHCRILDDIGQYLLREVCANVKKDFEIAHQEGYEPRLSHHLWERYVPFGFRRPHWPVNCYVAMEAQGAVLSNVIFGVKAPDSSKIKSAEKVFACPSRKILEKLRDKVPGGRRTVWWPWMQALPHPYLGPEFAARIILDSPTATVEDSPEIQDLGRLFVEMATEVDKLLGE
jgi:hypothetical protein